MLQNAVERIPIRTISSLTGVKPMTLRAWERRYGLVRPQRTPKGHRLYTHQHVERIRRVLTLIERGVPVALASDCNPGTCPTENLPLVGAMACTQMKMLPAEVVTALTLNWPQVKSRSASPPWTSS